MLRNFDVHLMVIISALLSQRAFQQQKDTPLTSARFCIRRAKRLVYPTWIFLSAYFSLLFFTGQSYSAEYYFYSFLLTRYAVGYVWIVLIYLYSALLVPLCIKTSTLKYPLLYIGAIYLVYELMCHFKIGTAIKLIDSTVYYIIPYGLLTYLGFNYRRFNSKAKMIIISVSAAIFGGLAVYYWMQHGTFQDVQIAKYPPRANYLSYGIFVSFLLLYVCEKIKLRLYTNRMIVFISHHSMWIYLWHVMALYLYNYWNLPRIWYIKFPAVYSASIIMVFITNKLFDCIDRDKKCSLFQYLRH